MDVEHQIIIIQKFWIFTVSDRSISDKRATYALIAKCAWVLSLTLVCSLSIHPEICVKPIASPQVDVGSESTILFQSTTLS